MPFHTLSSFHIRPTLSTRVLWWNQLSSLPSTRSSMLFLLLKIAFIGVHVEVDVWWQRNSCLEKNWHQVKKKPNRSGNHNHAWMYYRGSPDLCVCVFSTRCYYSVLLIMWYPQQWIAVPPSISISITESSCCIVGSVSCNASAVYSVWRCCSFGNSGSPETHWKAFLLKINPVQRPRPASQPCVCPALLVGSAALPH